jgi:hypothetical protein
MKQWDYPHSNRTPPDLPRDSLSKWSGLASLFHLLSLSDLLRLVFEITEKQRYPDELMKIAHMRYPGRRFKPRATPANKAIKAERLYSLRTLMEWMMKWVLVRPRMALGFRLNIVIKLPLSRFGKIV